MNSQMEGFDQPCDWSKLNKVKNGRGRVLLVKDSLGVGLILVELDQPVVCLFKLVHIIKRRGRGEQMSSWMSEGSRVRCNAIKVHNHNIVALVATTVWFDGEDFAKVNVDAVYKPVNEDDLESYKRLAGSLSWDMRSEDKELVLRSFKNDRSHKYSSRERESYHDCESSEREHGRGQSSEKHSRSQSRHYSDREGNRYTSHRKDHEGNHRSSDRNYNGPGWDSGGGRESGRGDLKRSRGQDEDRDQRSGSRDHRGYDRRDSKDDKEKQSRGYGNQGSNDKWYNTQALQDNGQYDVARNGREGGDLKHAHSNSNRHERRSSDDRTDSTNLFKDRRSSKDMDRGLLGENGSEVKASSRETLRRPRTPRGAGAFGEVGSVEPSSLPNSRPVTPSGGAESRSSSRASSRPATPRGANYSPDRDAGSGLNPAAEPSDISQEEKNNIGVPDSKQSIANTRVRIESGEVDNPGPAVIAYQPMSKHTDWRSLVPDEVNPKLFSEISSLGPEGHSVQLDSWIDAERGLVKTRDGYNIVFHVNQMWELINRSYWTEMMEMYSLADIQRRFQIGTKLRCQYRKQLLGTYSFQATCLWRDGAGPQNYRTETYLSDLNRIAKEHREDTNITPSLFSKTRVGTVQEFISYETGLIRMLDGDNCVALFSLDQVWEAQLNNKGDYLKNGSTASLHNYLPVGSLVYVIVRCFPHEKSSQLQYQCSLVWKKEFGQSTPTGFSVQTATRKARLELSKALDKIHDRIKKSTVISVLYPQKNVDPVIVPVFLNLLPVEGSAKILPPLSSEAKHVGLIEILMPDPRNTGKQIKLYAIFHMDDVYDESGTPYTKNNSDKAVIDLRKVEVDVIARCISSQTSYSKVMMMVDALATGFKDQKVPLLQAVVVFIKPPGSLVTGAAPIPTFFRPEPTSINRKQISTAYYFNVSLRARLDLKVYEYLDNCGISISNAFKNFLHGRFLDQNLVKMYRSQVPRYAVGRLIHLDVSGDIRYNYGVLDKESLEVPSISLPASLRDHGVTIKFIWLERPNPKYGLARLQIDNKPVMAFFSTGSINSKRYVSDMSTLVWKNIKYVMANGILMDANSKVPYVLTEMWIIGDKMLSWKAKPDVIKEEWAKVVPSMLGDKHSLNYMSLRKLMANLPEKPSDQLAPVLHQSVSVPNARQPEILPPNLTNGWMTSLKNVTAKVAKIINANYACAVSVQRLPNSPDKLFFILFDRFDLYKDGDLVVDNAEIKSKPFKEIMKEGDSVRLHGVYMKTESPMNLVYLATAAVTHPGDTPPLLPEKAKYLVSCASIKEDKAKNFKVVSAAVMKKGLLKDNSVAASLNAKPAPAPSVFKEHFTTRPAYTNNRKIQAKEVRQLEDSNAREHEFARISAAKRQELILNKPEVYKELKPMESFKAGQYFYDCKVCGIQGMCLEDSEDHLTTEEHIKAKVRSAGQDQKPRFQNREEADEAIFLNNNKAIKLEEWKGKRSYTCTECKAMKMPLLSAMKHVTSTAHKRKYTTKNVALDQECKEMRRRLERSGIVYHCQPCAFQTGNIAQNKDHIQEESHKRKTTFYCHPCKNFSRDKNDYENHRFSIKHKKACTKLEEDCSKPFVKPRKIETPREPPKNEDDKPKDPELTCSLCNFTAKGPEEFTDHKGTLGHRQQEMFKVTSIDWKELRDFKFENPGTRCTTMEEMVLVRRGKDLKELGEQDKSLRDNEDLKKKQEQLITIIFKGQIFVEQDIKTRVKCNTCKTVLNGKEKQLSRQLLIHLISDKHNNNLRVQIKEEGHSKVDRNTAQQREEEEEAARAAAEAESSQVDDSTDAFKAPVVSSTDSAEDKLAWLKNNSQVVCAMNETLFYCVTCVTGAKPLEEFFEHMMSQEHQTGMCPTREWRLYLEMMDIYEHGDGYFKCLTCDTGFMEERELRLHLDVMEHIQRFHDENKDARILKQLPIKAPVCPTCKLRLSSQLDLKIHEKNEHKKEISFTADQIENLKVVSQSRNLTLSPTIIKAEGRVLQTLPASNFGLIQVPKEDNQYINVLYDLTRLDMSGKASSLSKSVMPGYPVLVTAVMIEPQEPGISQNIPYYATAVTKGNDDDHNEWPIPFSTLKTELGSTMTEALRLSKAALAVQLESFSSGVTAPLFHFFPDQLVHAGGIVLMKNQSVLLVKLPKDDVYAIQILESVILSDSNPVSAGEETFEVGDNIEINALLMDPAKPTQYLITGCWCTTSPRSTISRSSLSHDAANMFHSLAVAYCMEPSTYPELDMSSILVPTSDGLGFDDIAADMSDLTEDIDVDDPMPQEPAIAADEDDGSFIPFKKIKLFNFSKND